MRSAWKKIRYRLEWLGLKSATKIVPLLSRKACYRVALLLGSLGAVLDRRGRHVALSNLRVAFAPCSTSKASPFIHCRRAVSLTFGSGDWLMRPSNSKRNGYVIDRICEQSGIGR